MTDLIEGLHRLAVSGEHTPVNLGNPAEVSLLDLAAEIIRLTGSDSAIVHQALPLDDPRMRRPDIARAVEVLGLGAPVPLAEGLQSAITFECNNHSHALTAMQ